jgi:hypothetical protein
VLHDALPRCRVIVMPLLNPVGMARGQRANGNGIDLMRNAPAHELGGTPMVGGTGSRPSRTAITGRCAVTWRCSTSCSTRPPSHPAWTPSP